MPKTNCRTANNEWMNRHTAIKQMVTQAKVVASFLDIISNKYK